MEMKKLFKGTLLLGSVFVLAACSANEETKETTVAETTVVTTTEVITTEATTTLETTTEATTTLETTTEAATTEAATTSEETTEATETTDAGETEGLQDGTYTVVGYEDKRGWTVKHTIEVADGKVTASDFDYFNAEGERKSENEEYNKNMKEKTGASASEAVDALNVAFLETQSAKVEVVTGATHTSHYFEESAAALLTKAAAGDTEVTNFQTLQDGEYTLETNEDERGWAHIFTIEVKDGKIVTSAYDMKNADDQLKSESDEYNTNMKDKAGVSFAEAVEALNAALVEKQNTNEIDVVSGATNTTDSFVKYARLLVEAAIAGNTDKIEVVLEAN